MQNKYLVYIAGKLNDDACGYIKNLNKMIYWGNLVMHSGFCVFIPGLDFLAGLLDGTFGYHEYFDNNQLILERSDAIFLVPGWKDSDGTKKELEKASLSGIPVFDGEKGYSAINDMINWFEDAEGLDDELRSVQ